MATTLFASNLAPPRPEQTKRRLLKAGLSCVVVAMLVWSWLGTQMDLIELAQRSPYIVEFLDGMFPPDLAWNEYLFSISLEEQENLNNHITSQVLRTEFDRNGSPLFDGAAVSVEEKSILWLIIGQEHKYYLVREANAIHIYEDEIRAFPRPLRLAIPAIATTLQICLLGTAMGTAAALLLGFCAAGNLTPNWVHHPIKIFLGSVRSIPVLILGLLFFLAMGFKLMPGVLAIAIHSMGMLGKLFAEESESVDAGVWEAIDSAGANWFQKVRYAIWPRVAPEFCSLTLFRLEMNIRDSTVLGFIGITTLGFYMENYRRAFDYPSVCTFVIVTMLLVLAVDQVSLHIRRHLT